MRNLIPSYAGENGIVIDGEDCNYGMPKGEKYIDGLSLVVGLGHHNT